MIPALLVPSVRPRALLRGTPVLGFTGGSQQLTLRQYAIGGGYTDTNSGVTWSSGDGSVATVNSTGLVSFVGVGSTTITATYGGIAFPATVNVLLDEVTMLRNLVGSDAAWLNMHSVTSTINAGGFVSAWPDLRGGSNPTLTASGTVSLTGSGFADNYVVPDGSSGVLLGNITASLDLVNDKTLIYVGQTLDPGGAGSFPLQIETADGASYLAIGVRVGSPLCLGGFSTASGTFAALQTQASPISTRTRMVAASTNGSNGYITVPRTARIASTITPHVSASCRLAFGRNYNNRYNPSPARFLGALNLVAGQTLLDNLRRQWAYPYHLAAHGAPLEILQDGDSNTEGHGLSDYSLRWGALLSEDAAFANPVWSMDNCGIAGAEIRSGGFASRIDAVSSNAALYFDATQTTKIVILGPGLGTNDLVSGGQTGQTTAIRKIALCDAWKAAVPGVEIIAMSTTPRGTGSQASYDTESAAHDTYFSANWPGHADAYINLRLLTAFNSPSNYSNSTYYQGDQTHYTAATHTQIYGAVRPVVLSLIAA